MKRTLLLLSFLLLFVGCFGTDEEAKASYDSAVVEAAWLRDNLNSVYIVDARSPLDGVYSEGHISGAIPVPILAVFSETGLLKDAATLSTAISGIGLDGTKTIVVYGNNHASTNAAFGQDGRIAWALKMAGLNVKILNGGYKQWTALGYDVVTEATTLPATNFSVSTLKDWVVSTEEVKSAIDNESAVIIDSRSREEYDGAQIFDEERGGHLPGAKHIFFMDFMNAETTLLLPAEDIVALLESKGIAKDDAIYPYCTSGIRSAFMTMILQALGYTNAKNYDASFWYWSLDTSLPLE